MKKRIISTVLVLLTLAICLSVTMLVSAGSSAPVLNIEAKNLAFENNLYLVYYVSHENVDAKDVKLLVWTTPQAEYTYGTQNEILSCEGSTTYNQKDCLLFAYKGLKAKNMADDIYVRAYTAEGGIYSPTVKYSALQYAYNKLGKTGVATENEALKALLQDMLDYGASVQSYLGYKTNRLANAAFYQVAVEDGTLADGFASGLYTEGEPVTVKAPAKNAEGDAFVGWYDASNKLLSKDATYTFAIGNANTALSAVYNNVYTVTVQNGTFQNGKTTATVNRGDSITMTANSAPNGYAFSHWEDENGNTLGEERALTVNPTASLSYKAYYKVAFADPVRILSSVDDWQQGAFNGSLNAWQLGNASRVTFKAPYLLHTGEKLTVKLPSISCPVPNSDGTCSVKNDGTVCTLNAAILIVTPTGSNTGDLAQDYSIVSGGWDKTYTATKDTYVMVMVKWDKHGSTPFSVENAYLRDVEITVETPLLKNYWKPELEDAITKIEANRNTIGNGISEFFFLTDAHWPDNAGYSPALINYLAEKLECYNVVFDGDIIRRYNADKQAAIDDEINAFYNALELYTKTGEKLRIMTSLGNHDRNGSSGNTNQELRLTEQEAYDLYLKRMEGWGVTVKGDANRSYYDDVENKVRYIQFYFAGSQYNMIEDAYVDSALAWAEEQILALDSDWTVVLFTHGFFCDADGATNEITPKDDEVARRILALQGKADAEIAIWITGHIHEERNEILYDEFGNKVRLVSINCDAYGNSNTKTNGTLTSFNMKPGTLTEQSFCFIQVDTKNEKIYLTRLGAGDDKVFNFGSKLEAGTENFHKISVKVQNGLIEGKTSSQNVKSNTEITIVADTISGYTFSHWVDKNGTTVATTATAKVNVGTEPNTYTAVYTASAPTTPEAGQILSDLANDWVQGSYDGKFQAWDESLRSSRVTSKVMLLKAGQTVSISYPDPVDCPLDSCTGGTCSLACAIVVLEKVDGSNTGDQFTDYRVVSYKWGKTYTNNTSEDVYVVIMFKYNAHGGTAAFTLSNDYMKEIVITVK